MDTNTEIILTGLFVFSGALFLFGKYLVSFIKDLVGHQVAMGEMVSNHVKHVLIKEKFFDGEARTLQEFLEKMLGPGFNVQSIYVREEKLYRLWIWKRHDTRDMGCHYYANSPAVMISGFMEEYYRLAYFSDVDAFPDKD